MKIRLGRKIALGVMVGIALIGTETARAQAPLVEGEQTGAARALVSDPAIIGRCLCEARRVSGERALLESLDREYRAAKAHAQATEAAVNRVRPLLKADDGEQIDAYRRLLVESQRADHDLYGMVQPVYAAQVARYNQAVNSYNQGCAGMEVDQALQSRVGQALACPVP